MKKLFLLMVLCLALVGTLAGCGAEVRGDEAEESRIDFEVGIVKAISTQDNGEPCVRVDYGFRNLTDSNKCFIDMARIRVYQNGVELKWHVGDTEADTTERKTSYLKPGADIIITQYFDLDSRSDILIELSDLYGNVIESKTIKA